MVKIYLLTAPLDEQAMTGDGQYAKSIEHGFLENYPRTVSCNWLKRDDKKYAIPFPEEATSVPVDTIPSAMVLQPVSNEKTTISGFKLTSEDASASASQAVNSMTVTPRTPKVIVKHDNSLHSLTIMDIYTKQPMILNIEKVKEVISSLEIKKTRLLEAVDTNHEILSSNKLNTKIKKLTKAYNANEGEIQSCCTLNEYLEAHLSKSTFLDKHQKALKTFEELERKFSGPVNYKELEILTEQFTGVKAYCYDFQSNGLIYDLINVSNCRKYYGFSGLKDSVDLILTRLRKFQEIRLAVSQRNEHSFIVLNEVCESEKYSKLEFIDLIYKDGFAEIYDRQTFVDALLDSMPADKMEKVIDEYDQVSEILANKGKLNSDMKLVKQLVEKLQTIVAHKDQPYLSANKGLAGFYGKRKLTASEGFHLAYEASRRDPLKPQVISNLIDSMQPIDENTFLDIHIRPPDCGVLISPEDIKRFQKAGIKVNLTIHEYKQNYTRRYLQQYTHDLMREADTVQFFNELDRDNAIIAATYGDCDKRNTMEASGIAKKEREVGHDYELEKFPVATYNLKDKSGLTVASQTLSTVPAHPKDVVSKDPNILSFGTIRPGKGFEEALALAKLINEKISTISRQIPKVPVVKIAGDPQDFALMQEIVIERFGKDAVDNYQKDHAVNRYASNDERIKYWQKLVKDLNKQVEDGVESLRNPYLEIYPWCTRSELLRLKDNSKYVCRMDDMGMRNNGSAIISVLDVGIVYTKFGSVTDDIFVKAKGGRYAKAIDIGEYRFGKFSLEKMRDEHIKKHGSAEGLPKLLEGRPYSHYKRQSQSREPQEILDSIIEREINQLEHLDELERSDNYLTVLEAQKLLLEHFTLKSAVDHLLENVGLKHLISTVQPMVPVEPAPSAAPPIINPSLSWFIGNSETLKPQEENDTVLGTVTVPK